MNGSERRRAGRRTRIGKRLVIGGVLTAIVVGFVWFAVSRIGGGAEAQIPHTAVNPLGANFFLDREVEPWKREKTLEMARAIGVGWIKQQFSWEELEPDQKGTFHWEKHDHIVELADDYEMEVIARIDRTPSWARPGSPFPTAPPEDAEDFGDFVEAFVDHYRGRVRYLQIWNEPNLAAEWGFDRVDAVAYTRLLGIAHRRAKDADPNIVVLSAPLAFTLEDASMRGNHNDLVFLEEMYQAGAAEFFDVLSANGFGLDRPPDDAPDPSLLNLRRVELQRAIMEAHGDGDKPIWLNEYGWNAAPASFPEELLTWERVTTAEQASYTVEGIQWARRHWPWLGVVNIWYFRQVGDVPPDRAAYYFALVSPEFEPQPVYYALQSASQSGDWTEPRPGSVADATRLAFIALAGLCSIVVLAGAAAWISGNRQSISDSQD